MVVSIDETDCAKEKVVKITYAATEQTLDGMKARAHRLSKEFEALKYRDAGIVFKAPFAILGSVNEAMYYGSAAEQHKIVSNFMESYSQLPELLKNQNQNEEQAKAFLEAVDWQK